MNAHMAASFSFQRRMKPSPPAIVRRAMRLRAATLALFIALGCSGCAHAQEATTRDADYFPISATARWEYATRVTLATGHSFAVKTINRFDGATLIGNKRYFKWISHSTGFPTPQKAQVSFYRIAEDGLRRIFSIEDIEKGRGEYLELPLPIPLGTPWLIQAPGGVTEARAERASSVQVDERWYTDCLKVTYRINSDEVQSEIVMYWARGIGMVKSTGTLTLKAGSATFEIKLVKYEP